MKILPRTQFGNPILRAKSKSVPAAFLKTAAFRNLIKQMFHTMRNVKGVGLAAPQIGKSIRLAVIGVPAARFRRVLVNPKITWHSTAKNLDWEGCLSFVDGRGQVPRWSAIKVEYTNEKGERVQEKHAGFLARVFQHEIDHLNGFVYVDRMTDMRTLMTHAEFIKRVVR
jgi:peptide deformylase